ncbi:helix-turn-helix transcriptional regulator, partial [Streptomyces hydrogenans]|uniref:helix-turn-helix domain-containing protein n=1 Tax=Streptomyces hydrogenans TaxID=1873719 RepID=UPI00345D1FE9
MTAVEERARDERRRRDAELRAVRERVLAGMRRIKEEFGLSYGRLAEKTHYSRSSWERFLNGKQWPSRAAIQQLADVVGQDPTPLIALWEHAEELARRSRHEGAGPEAQGEQEPERGEREGQDEGRGVTAPGPEEPTGRGKPLREERPAAGGAPASSREPDGADGSARAGAGPA